MWYAHKPNGKLCFTRKGKPIYAHSEELAWTKLAMLYYPMYRNKQELTKRGYTVKQQPA